MRTITYSCLYWWRYQEKSIVIESMDAAGGAFAKKASRTRECGWCFGTDAFIKDVHN